MKHKYCGIVVLLGLVIIRLVQGWTENETTYAAEPRNSGGILFTEDQCPPWFFYNITTKICECYSSPSTDHIVKCTEKAALLKVGYCMTYEKRKGFFVGNCNIKVNNLKLTTDKYIKLPDNVSDLNDYMCGQVNRQGPMCSQCADGFGLSVFSTGHPCTNCTGVWYGIPLYLFIEFCPLTVFYFVVMFFHINVTSAPMVAFVFYSQIAVSAFSGLVSNKHIFSTTIIHHLLNILISFYGIWNLDFFHFIFPPFCVSSHITPVHITFFYFISAFYPLFLIAMSWAFIHLYSRNFKPVVCLWKKLKHSRFAVSWDSKNTVIDVFASFFLLSYAKLVYASLTTLSYGISLNVNNNSLQQTLHVKLDPSMKFFRKEHLPFAITSIFIFLLTVFPIPLVLAFYPVRSFRTLVFKCPIGSRTITAINIFVQTYYSCYRDGTEGGRDMRSLVSLYFFLRLLLHLAPISQIPRNVGFSIIVFIYITCGILIALAQPYKRSYMNIVDTVILANLAVLSLILSQVSVEVSYTSTQFFYISGSIFASLPLFGMIGMLIYKIIRKIRNLHCCKRLLLSYQRNKCDDTKDYDQLILESCDTELVASAADYEKEHCCIYHNNISSS